MANTFPIWPRVIKAIFITFLINDFLSFVQGICLLFEGQISSEESKATFWVSKTSKAMHAMISSIATSANSSKWQEFVPFFHNTIICKVCSIETI